MIDLKRQAAPAARKEGLVVQELPDEVLIYDLDADKAHCLNRTAAAIWKSCDGKKTIAEISKILERQTADGEKQTSAHEDLVWLAIEQLSERNLLETSTPKRFGGQTRRDVIRKIGLAASVALPIVTSLAAPTVASAGSTCNGTQSCGTCTLNTDPNTNSNVCMNAGGCVCNSATGSGACTANCSCNQTCTVSQNSSSCSSPMGSVCV